MDKSTEDKEQRVKYVDLKQFEFDDITLLFFRSKLDEFAIQCFRMVVRNRKTGLNKTKIEDYLENRKRYDVAFMTLEVAGFIEKGNQGISKPYYPTIRGLQLVKLLSEEKQRENNDNQRSDT